MGVLICLLRLSWNKSGWLANPFAFRWAMRKGFGAALLHDPDRIKDMVLTVRRRVSDDTHSFSISTKIRINSDIRYYAVFHEFSSESSLPHSRSVEGSSVWC